MTVYAQTCLQSGMSAAYCQHWGRQLGAPSSCYLPPFHPQGEAMALRGQLKEKDRLVRDMELAGQVMRWDMGRGAEVGVAGEGAWSVADC